MTTDTLTPEEIVAMVLYSQFLSSRKHLPDDLADGLIGEWNRIKASAPGNSSHDYYVSRSKQIAAALESHGYLIVRNAGKADQTWNPEEDARRSERNLSDFIKRHEEANRLHLRTMLNDPERMRRILGGQTKCVGQADEQPTPIQSTKGGVER